MAEFCENGAGATLPDLTGKRASPDFFARHTVSELPGWSDFDRENEGRPTHPLRCHAATDRDVETSRERAFRETGPKLQGFAPEAQWALGWFAAHTRWTGRE